MKNDLFLDLKVPVPKGWVNKRLRPVDQYWTIGDKQDEMARLVLSASQHAVSKGAKLLAVFDMPDYSFQFRGVAEDDIPSVIESLKSHPLSGNLVGIFRLSGNNSVIEQFHRATRYGIHQTGLSGLDQIGDERTYFNSQPNRAVQLSA